MATLSDNVVVSKQTGKVRDKDRTWDSVKKSLLGNINGFLEELKVWSPGPSTTNGSAIIAGYHTTPNKRNTMDELNTFPLDVTRCFSCLFVNYYDTPSRSTVWGMTTNSS